MVPDAGGAAGGRPADRREDPVRRPARSRCTGADAIPQLVGLTSNISLQAWRAGEAAITALMTEATLKATAEWCSPSSAAGAAAATSVAEAVGALEAASWPATPIIGPATRCSPRTCSSSTSPTSPCVPVDTGGATLVVAQPGTWVGYSDAVVTATEPSIGGMAVTAYAWAVADAGPGAVATIASTTTERPDAERAQRWPPQLIDDIVTVYRSGLSRSATAARVGVPRMVVDDVLLHGVCDLGWGIDDQRIARRLEEQPAGGDVDVRNVLEATEEAAYGRIRDQLARMWHDFDPLSRWMY